MVSFLVLSPLMCTDAGRIFADSPEVFVQLMEQLSSTVTMQQQGRDQLHDLRLGQRALATREEIVEDIAGQRELSPPDQYLCVFI